MLWEDVSRQQQDTTAARDNGAVESHAASYVGGDSARKTSLSDSAVVAETIPVEVGCLFAGQKAEHCMQHEMDQGNEDFIGVVMWTPVKAVSEQKLALQYQSYLEPPHQPSRTKGETNFSKHSTNTSSKAVRSGTQLYMGTKWKFWYVLYAKTSFDWIVQEIIGLLYSWATKTSV